jgi:Protein of unknown function (DUF1214)
MKLKLNLIAGKRRWRTWVRLALMGQRRQVSHPAAGLQREDSGRLHRDAIGQFPRLRIVALDPPDRRRRGRCESGYLRETHEGLSNLVPYDARFFDSLNRMVQSEPWLTCDKAMIDPLRTIGIEKGKPFQPDARTRAILDDAANEAHAWLETNYEALFNPPYYEGTGWALLMTPELIKSLQTQFSDPDSYPVDNRGVIYTMAFFSPKRSGAGSFYLMTIKGETGNAFDGGSAYRLHVPVNAPVRQFWSATAYDRATHGLIRNLPRSSRSSQNPELQKIPTAQWTFISDLRLRRVRNRTGFRRALKENSKCSSVSMVRRKPCSRKRGSCRTSRR